MEMTTANTVSSTGGGGGGGGIGGGQTGDSAGTNGVDGVLAPIAAQVEEPQYTRKKVKEFLTHHSAYELIPESGKVVLLDIDLPLRQAFHALHEQGLASAPLYCSESGTIAGVVSASDFIATLQRLRSMVSTSTNPMSEQEMDQHTIRGLREEMAAEGRPSKPLVCVAPGNSLAQVVRTMYENHCSMAPVLHQGPNGQLVREGSLGGNGGGGGGGGSTSASAVGGDDCDGPQVLHTASLAGVLACLMRHFRASLASLPLLAQPLHSLPVGTWNPESPVALQTTGAEEVQPAIDGVQRRGRRIVPIKVVHHNTLLNEAMGLLVEAGISCLPVVDDSGALIDIYARSDVTMLAKSNAYNRLQFEDVTVGQALALTAEPGPPPQLSVTQPAAPPQWPSPNSSSTSMHDAAMAASSRQRVHVCTSQDALRFVVDRLATPGVRRVFVVHAETRRVEGIVSLSDVASFMLL
jgi:CBS domain-containing protein